MMRLVFVTVDFLREPCLLVGPCSPRCEPVPYSKEGPRLEEVRIYDKQYVISLILHVMSWYIGYFS